MICMKIHVSFLGYSQSGKNLKFSKVSGSATNIKLEFKRHKLSEWRLNVRSAWLHTVLFRKSTSKSAQNSLFKGTILSGF